MNFLIIWILIGLITSISSTIYDIKVMKISEYTVKDILLGLLFILLGPIASIVLICYIFETSNLLNKVVYKQKINKDE